MDVAEKRGEIIKHLEAALVIADEIEDEEAGYLSGRWMQPALVCFGSWQTKISLACAQAMRDAAFHPSLVEIALVAASAGDLTRFGHDVAKSLD